MRLAERHSADLELQEPKIQALFRLLFAVYERGDRQADQQERLNDELRDLIKSLEQTGVFLLQAHSKASIEAYLTDKEAERQ